MTMLFSCLTTGYGPSDDDEVIRPASATPVHTQIFPGKSTQTAHIRPASSSKSRRISSAVRRGLQGPWPVGGGTSESLSCLIQTSSVGVGVDEGGFGPPDPTRRAHHEQEHS